MSDQEFEITTKETTTGVTIVSVNGFLDAQTFEIMELKLSELIRDRKTKLIINLKDTEYISSAGAGVFITARTQTEELGGAILLMNPNEAWVSARVSSISRAFSVYALAFGYASFDGTLP